MHCIIVVEFVAEVFVELSKETILDKGRRRSVHSWFALGIVSESPERVMEA